MGLTISKKPWWTEEPRYHDSSPLGPLLDPDLWGNHGPALVKVYPNGSTQQGWGLTGRDGAPGFMERYERNQFLAKRALHWFEDGDPFAFVMRSGRLVCIDIDGKNGGIEHASELGALPLTTAETSKSGTGYHLFYTVADNWSETEGFAAIADYIGIVQGVDIRGTGCVYHHAPQRWNNVAPAPLPDHLFTRLTVRREQQRANHERILKILETTDDLEVLMMHDELVTELNKPIHAGKRNNTLFAIGSQMKQAQVPDWQGKVGARAEDVGLDPDEVTKLVANIEAYN